MALYSANYYVKNYLIGKEFEPVSSDYRYWYFTDDEALQTALEEMPNWMRISKAPLWGS